MAYGLFADLVMVAHLAFLGYLVVGGFLAWRWRRTIWLHIPVVAWGFSTVLVGIDCPLTHAENSARARAGLASLPPDGFVAHYLTGVIYPESALELVRVLVVTCVVLSWIGYTLTGRVRTHRHTVPR
ncbi:MAG: DUF2784 domain-containing protein [Aldersonia sp.]|nr:DUF2784 domain-containing protein [Aldersonia sp.]